VRWNDVVAAGASARLPPQAHVRRVDTSATGRIAFLTDEADATRVTAAIREVVIAVRESQ
jgi:hypothetical protein